MARLESDTYAIQRALSGTKEIRFKQLCYGGGHLYGLTEDGEVYWWTVAPETNEWHGMPMAGSQ